MNLELTITSPVSKFVESASVSRSLADLIREKRNGISYEQVLGFAISLSLQLERLHESGTLHRAINPSNVLLDGSRAQLIHNRIHSPLEHAYMPPEQSGLLESTEIGPYSDLYSLGVVFFELATGALPFKGDTLHEILQNHLKTPVMHLTTGRSDFPEVFDELIQRLLAKNPSERYQTASSLVRDLEKIQSIPETSGSFALGIGSADKRKSLAFPSFVGRDREISEFRELLKGLKKSEGGLVYLEGPSGIGKSRLLNSMLMEARRQGIQAFCGATQPAEGQHPLQCFDGVFTGIREEIEKSPNFKERLIHDIGQEAEALSVIAPQIAQILKLKIASRELGPETFGEIRSHRAFSTFIDSLGTTRSPAVVLLDDLQWSDDLTLRSLEYWHKNNRGNVLLVAAFRSEETPKEHLLRTLSPRCHFSLAALGEIDLGRMATSMAGPLPEKSIAWLTKLSDGNPFFAEALLRGMIESSYLTWRNDHWEVCEEKVSELQLAHRAASYFSKSIENLPDAVKDLLSVGSILGRKFSLSEAALHTSEGKLDSGILITLSNRRLVWIDGDECQFVHDKVKEAFLKRLSPQMKQMLHERIAHRILSLRAEEGRSKLNSTRTWELAYHFSNAGLASLALPHALSAGREAKSRYALDIAEQQFRIASLGSSREERSLCLQIHESLADVLVLRGKYADAEEQLQKCLNLTSSPMERARTLEKWGDLSFKKGDLNKAKTNLEDALRLLGRKVPKGDFGAAVRLAMAALRQATHTLFPRVFIQRHKKQMPEITAQVARIFNRMAYVYWFSKGRLFCLWAQFSGMNVAEGFFPSLELGQAYSSHAPIMSLVGAFRRGVKYAKSSVDIRRMLGDLWGEGQSQHFLGVLCYAAAKYSQCIEVCKEARSILLKTGDLWEVNISGYQIAASLYRLGNFKEAAKHSANLYRDAIATEDKQTSGIILDVWARSSPSTLPPEYLKRALSLNWEDAQAFAQVRLAAACVSLSKDNPEEGIAYLQEGIDKLKAYSISNGYVAPLYAWMLTALRMSLERMPITAIRHRELIFKKFRRASLEAKIMALRFPGEKPRILRERGIFAAAQGQARKARRLFKRSIAVAKVQEAKNEESESQSRLSTLEALEMVDSTSLKFYPQKNPASPSLVDLFGTLLEHGRNVASSLTVTDVYENLYKASRALLRGEQSLILGIDEHGIAKPLFGDISLPWSEAIVSEVQKKRETLIYNSASVKDGMEKIWFEKAQSILCAPIIPEGEGSCYLYIVHNQLQDVFTDEIKRLSRLICSIAGAAIENSRLYQGKLEANRLKDEFLAILSHELRTPMTAISGWVDMLMDGSIPAVDYHETWEILRRNSDTEMRLIDDMLDISRAMTGKIQLQRKTVDVREVLNSAKESVVFAAKQKQVELLFDLPGEPIVISCDPMRVEQIMRNLLTNSVKFTPKDGSIVVKACKIENQLNILITDTGIGIEPDFLPFLFQKFRQQDGSMKRSYGGLGLGLAIVKHLVELHGGSIQACSEGPGKGSQFSVQLPANF